MTNAQFAQGLRELAEIYDKHPFMLRPWKDQISLHLEADRQTLPATLTALADGGQVDKVAPRADDIFYRVRRTLPSGITVVALTDRSKVCRRVQKMQIVETWECPDSILDPEVE